MRKIIVMLACVTVASAACGCQSNKSRVAEGAVIGGILGAAAGGIIGQQSHHGSEGAGIGAATGLLAGALLGSQIQKPGQPTGPAAQGAQPISAAQANNPNQLSFQQIIDMSKQGANEAVIIDKIRLTNSRYALSATDIGILQQQGVSQKVIDEMRGAGIGVAR